MPAFGIGKVRGLRPISQRKVPVDFASQTATTRAEPATG
jgi:hypothetical protein